MNNSVQQNLTPHEIVAELDKYIIGQADAKRNVAIALRNRWRRMSAPAEMQNDIVPNNILMIGATGVGKTEIARRLAHIANAPFIKVEASKYTEVGYVGRDVESMVRDLVEQSVKLIKIEKKQAVQEKALENAEEIILDALIPPLKSGGIESEDEVLNEKTREKFREKIKNKELEDKKIEIEIAGSGTSVNILGSMGPDEGNMDKLQEMLESVMPRRARKRKVTIEEARKILTESEAAKLIDMEEVKDEAIYRAENTGIIFIDEIDKIAAGTRESGQVSREGVQRDLLPIVEGSTVNTKYGLISTDHILFIAAGAFHVSKPSDLIPELQGRFPIRVELDSLNVEDFYQILQTPKNSLTRQYVALLATENVELIFKDEALHRLAEIAFESNASVENIGARRLQTVMSHLLNEFLFDIPDKIAPNTVLTVTKDLVNERLNSLVKNRDLSRYIL
jgi:ATP-dependent HslUV protease ATP-binding subunit HslU